MNSIRYMELDCFLMLNYFIPSSHIIANLLGIVYIREIPTLCPGTCGSKGKKRKIKILPLDRICTGSFNSIGTASPPRHKLNKEVGLT